MNVNEYLNLRNVKDKDYLHFVKNNPAKFEEFKLCSVRGFDFMVSHFLDNRSKMGYGIISTNKQLELDDTKYLAIGLIEGDDVICLDLISGAIYLWMIENGDGEFFKVAKSFGSFIKMVL